MGNLAVDLEGSGIGVAEPGAPELELLPGVTLERAVRECRLVLRTEDNCWWFDFLELVNIKVHLLLGVPLEQTLVERFEILEHYAPGMVALLATAEQESGDA